MIWSAPYFAALSVGGPTPRKRFAISAGFAFCAAFLPWGGLIQRLQRRRQHLHRVRAARQADRPYHRIASGGLVLVVVAAMITSSNSSRQLVATSNSSSGAPGIGGRAGVEHLPQFDPRWWRRRVVRFALVRGANLANPTLGLLALPNSSVRNLVTVSCSSDGYFPIRIFDLDPLPLVSSFASVTRCHLSAKVRTPAQPEENFSRVGRGAVSRWL